MQDAKQQRDCGHEDLHISCECFRSHLLGVKISAEGAIGSNTSTIMSLYFSSRRPHMYVALNPTVDSIPMGEGRRPPVRTGRSSALLSALLSLGILGQRLLACRELRVLCILWLPRLPHPTSQTRLPTAVKLARVCCGMQHGTIPHQAGGGSHGPVLGTYGCWVRGVEGKRGEGSG